MGLRHLRPHVSCAAVCCDKCCGVLCWLQVSQAEVLIEERDEEIRKIVETIAELAQIMRDLSTLVVEQGTMLDRIDTNITQAAVKVRPHAPLHPRFAHSNTCLQ